MKKTLQEQDQPKDLTKVDQSMGDNAQEDKIHPSGPDTPPAGAPTKTEKPQDTSSEEIQLASGKTISKEDGKQLIIKALSNFQIQLSNGQADEEDEDEEAEPGEEPPKEEKPEEETEKEEPEDEEKVMTSEPPPQQESRVQNITGLKKALCEGDLSLSRPEVGRIGFDKLADIGKGKRVRGIKNIVSIVRESKLHPLASTLLENVDFAMIASFGTIRQSIAAAETLKESELYPPEEIGFAVAQIRNKKTSGNFLLEKEDRKTLSKMLVEEISLEPATTEPNQTAVDVAQGTEKVMAADQIASYGNALRYEPVKSVTKEALLLDGEFNKAVINGNQQAAFLRAKELFPNETDNNLHTTLQEISFTPIEMTANPSKVEDLVNASQPVPASESVPEVQSVGIFSTTVEYDAPQNVYDVTNDAAREVPVSPAEISSMEETPPEAIVDYDNDTDYDDEFTEGYLKKVGKICEVQTRSGTKKISRSSVALLPPGSGLDSALRMMERGESVKKIARKRLYARVEAVPAKYIRESKMKDASFFVVYLGKKKGKVVEALKTTPGYLNEDTKVIPLNSLTEKERIEILNLCESLNCFVLPSRSSFRIDKSKSICEQEDVENATEENAIATAYADGVSTLKTAQSALVDFQGILGKVTALMSVNGSKKTDINKTNKISDSSKEILEMVKDVIKSFSDQQEAFKKDYPDAEEKVPEVAPTEPVSEPAPSETDPSLEPSPEQSKDLSTTGTESKVESVAKGIVKKYGETFLQKDLLETSKIILLESKAASLSYKEANEVSDMVRRTILC